MLIEGPTYGINRSFGAPQKIAFPKLYLLERATERFGPWFLS